MSVLKELQSALACFGNMICVRNMVVNIILELVFVEVWEQMFVFA